MKPRGDLSDLKALAAKELTGLDLIAARLSVALCMEVQVARFNVTSDANSPVSYRIRFTEAERSYLTDEAMSRQEAKRFLSKLLGLAKVNLIAGVVTGGPLRDDRFVGREADDQCALGNATTVSNMR